MQDDIKEPQQAWNEFVAVMKKERFPQKVLVAVFCFMVVNWTICNFIGWSLNPHLTQMEVLMHSLDFFEWNFEISLTK